MDGKSNFIGWLKKLEFYRFCLFSSLTTFLVSIVVGASYSYYIDGVNLFSSAIIFDIPKKPIYTLLEVSVIAPLIETLFNQLLVITILQKIKLPLTWIIILSTVSFSSIHLRNSLLSAINTIFLGFVLNYAYLHWLWRTQSRKRAFEGAMAIHALHNFFCYGLMFFRPG
ncbi:MAG TPA: CPBP family intramembrane glutamic endopeptidase [Candidatus Acidoferrum sp.]|nr:CPBP family intramembrane glutamic endopeptidase [Candidatus Acidoferrum sp.]